MITEEVRLPEGLPVPAELPSVILYYEGVELLPGTTRHVDVRWSAHPLRVRVTDLDGLPIAGARVSSRAEGSFGGAEGLTAPNGWADLRALGPGKHEIEVVQSGFVAAETEVQIPETGLAEPVVVVLERGTTCSGIVRLPETQAEALDALEADSVLADALGEGLLRSYVAVRRSEWESYSAEDEAFEHQGHFLKY